MTTITASSFSSPPHLIPPPTPPRPPHVRPRYDDSTFKKASLGSKIFNNTITLTILAVSVTGGLQADGSTVNFETFDMVTLVSRGFVCVVVLFAWF